MTTARLLLGGLLLALVVSLAAVLGARQDAVAEAGTEWSYAQAMSQRRSYIAAAELAGEIYVAGGMVGESGRRLATVQRFDPTSDSWTTLTRMPEAIRAAAAVSLGDAFYVIGGDAQEGDGRQVYAYNPARDRWEPRASLPEPRFNHSAVALAGKIYSLGGYAEGSERDDVFVYEPAADRWSRVAPLPHPTHVFGAVVFDGEIWVLGGRRGELILREISIYNPSSDSWRAGPAMPKPMELLGATVVEDEIHALWESTYQILDVRTGDWREGPRSLTTRHGISLLSIENAVYAIGGCTTELRDSNLVETRHV